LFIFRFNRKSNKLSILFIFSSKLIENSFGIKTFPEFIVLITKCSFSIVGINTFSLNKIIVNFLNLFGGLHHGA